MAGGKWSFHSPSLSRLCYLFKNFFGLLFLHLYADFSFYKKASHDITNLIEVRNSIFRVCKYMGEIDHLSNVGESFAFIFL